MNIVSAENIVGTNIEELKKKKLVLFFYPKANTPGWTNEARNFSVLKNDFEEIGYAVYGVSRDSVLAQQRFVIKHDILVDVISDKDSELCNLFDVIKEKNIFGKIGLGIIRTTVVLDEGFEIVKRYDNVKVKDHAKIVLEDIKELSTN